MRKASRILLDALPRRFVLLDIGARGGMQHPWTQWERDLISVILVEADAEEAAQLQAQLRPVEGVVLPFALWDENGRVTLKLTKSRGCSSVLAPNRTFLDQFPDCGRFEVEREVSLEAVTLDSIADSRELPTIDFAKIDVQGAELAILKGGRGRLAANLIGLEAEVEFSPMYRNQPLFSDIDGFVREELGLELWDVRKTYWKHAAGIDAGSPKGQLIFGDALYLRPLHGLERWLEPLGREAAQEKIAMLVLASLVYGYADYALAVLKSSHASSLLDAPLRDALSRATACLGSGWRPFAHGHYRLYLVLDALARAFKPDEGGWATIGQPLGSRRRGPFWT